MSLQSSSPKFPETPYSLELVTILPVVTVIGLNFGLLLAGAILTETIFSWPGIGRYVVKAVQMRDYPAVQGCVLFFAFMFVVVNLITDVLYAFIDPRIKYD